MIGGRREHDCCDRSVKLCAVEPPTNLPRRIQTSSGEWVSSRSVAIPFIVGEYHALMSSDVAAMADIYGKGNNFVQVGVRGFTPGQEDLAWMRDQGFRCHFMAEVEKFDWDRVMERAITEASEGTDYLYISLDIDVLDPPCGPRTGTPELTEPPFVAPEVTDHGQA
jgi:hypothetical protein